MALSPAHDGALCGMRIIVDFWDPNLALMPVFNEAILNNQGGLGHQSFKAAVTRCRGRQMRN